MDISWSGTPASARVAGIAALAGFALSIESYRFDTRAGTCSYIDIGALACGIVAVLAAAVASLSVFGEQSSFRDSSPRWFLAAVTIGALMLGGYHIATGSGVLGGPCN